MTSLNNTLPGSIGESLLDMVTLKRTAEVNIDIKTRLQAEKLQAIVIFARNHIASQKFHDYNVTIAGPEITVHIPTIQNFLDDLERILMKNKYDMIK